MDRILFSKLRERVERKLLYVTSSNLVRSSGVYTISSFINNALPLLLLPVLTRKLTPADYGVVAMFQLAVSVFYPFISMNLEGSIARKYFDKDNTDFTAYIGTCFLLVIISLFIVSGVFWTNLNYIERITQIPKIWLKYVLLVAFCQFVTNAILSTYQVRVQPIKYGIFQISQSALNVGLTLLFVLILNKTWEGRLDAQILTGIAFALVSIFLFIINKQIKIHIIKEDILHALKFGLPLIPHAVGGMFFTAIDRFFLTNIVGLEQTGNYTVAYQIGAVVGIITFAFNNAYYPWLFEKLNEDKIQIKRRIVKFTYIYFILLMTGAVALLLIFPYIVTIFVGSSFKSIDTYSAFIVFGFVFQGMYYMVTNYILYAKKTYLQAILTLSIGLIKLPITYFSISILGARGASVSYCLTFLIFFVSTWILSSKVFPMPWLSVLKRSNTDEKAVV